MILNIINIFKNIARTYKNINSFYVGEIYKFGNGSEVYENGALLWIELPILGSSNSTKSNMLNYTINGNVTYLPNPNNYENRLILIDQAETDCINICESIKILNLFGKNVNLTYSITTLQHYYDNNVCGARFTININLVNTTKLCDLSSYFDENKQLKEPDTLPDFTVSDNGCLIKNNFDLKL